MLLLNLDVQFRDYSGIHNNIHTYNTGDSDNFHEIEIVEDFGPRQINGDSGFDPYQ